MFAEPIAHVDMDAFFVEVERLRRPELVGKAVVVGGAGPRGVVASASYEARRHGVRSAMPIMHARRLCPHAIVVPPEHAEYRRRSREVFAVIETITPEIETLSVDEAFLDIGGLTLLYDDARTVGAALRAAILATVGLPASVGIGTTKLIAKLASEAAKPDGMLIVPAGTELDFLHPLDVRALWGVGEATYARLEELGVRTVADLAAFPATTLQQRLGPALGAHLAALAAGEDPRPVTSGGGSKSISVEITYDEDLVDADRVERELLRHADRLAGRLRAARVRAKTIALKVRWSDFTTVSRSQTLDVATDTAHVLYDTARLLLGRAGGATRPIRLLGLGGEGLVDTADPRQLDLVDAGRWDEVEAAVDKVRRRFGDGSVQPARLSDRRPEPPDSSTNRLKK